MQIDITGYVTEELTSYSFAIKVTSDKVKHLSVRDIQVGKEVRIAMPPELYPFEGNNKFIELSGSDDPRREKINECFSFGKALKKGDQIECSVFIVDRETRAINRNPRDIETYAFFELWLYPNKGYFRRSESDSRESLKFRKQWRYTCINRAKYKNITGYILTGYKEKKWVNKNPKITRPILWWIRGKTTISNLWERLTRQENSPKKVAHKLAIIGIVFSIMGFVATIIFGIISIIF